MEKREKQSLNLYHLQHPLMLKTQKTHFLLLYPKEERRKKERKEERKKRKKKNSREKRRHEEKGRKEKEIPLLLQGQPAITTIFLDQMNLLVLSNVHPTDITGLCLSSTSSLPIQSFLLHPLGFKSLSKRLFAITLCHGAGGRGPDGGAGIPVLVRVVDAKARLSDRGLGCRTLGGEAEGGEGTGVESADLAGGAGETWVRGRAIVHGACAAAREETTTTVTASSGARDSDGGRWAEGAAESVGSLEPSHAAITVWI